MKALSLLQPWATLVMLGYKQYETRSWVTKHRGTLAIHASVGKPAEARNVCQENMHIRQILSAHGLTFDTLSRGSILGTVTVTGCYPINEALTQRLKPVEIACGDYSMPGRHAWLLENVWACSPQPCRGALSLWEVPAEVAAQLEVLRAGGKEVARG